MLSMLTGVELRLHDAHPTGGELTALDCDFDRVSEDAHVISWSDGDRFDRTAGRAFHYRVDVTLRRGAELAFMGSGNLTTTAVMRFSASFVGGASLTSASDPVARRTLAAGGVGVRRSRFATIMAAREATELSQPLRTITVAIAD